MAQSKRIIFVPGWMYSPGYFKLGEGLDVWEKDVDVDRVMDCDFLIGHSLGAAVVLKLWLFDRDKEIILVNPFIEQRSVWLTLFDWSKYAWQEGVYVKGRLNLGYFPKNFGKLLNLSREDYWSILKEIPKEKIKILHGGHDSFLCGRDVCDKLKKIGLEVVEVPEAGHNWHENFDREIEKIAGLVFAKK